MPEDKKKIRVLIADDDRETRETIADLLSEEGYRVQTTDCGASALELMEQTRFDLVISDLLMPGMNGIELTKTIRSRGIDIPIIVVTGFGTIEYAVESMKAGAFDFITKPFNVGHITFVVEKALETKRLMQMAGEREFYKQLSHSDELTKLDNFRSFSETLQTEIERARRYDRPLTMMMIDIDDFKNCNDTYGHLAGDSVLKQIALLIKKNTRGPDFVARYGGEEFVVILPETGVDEAYVVAERIREEIDHHTFLGDGAIPLGHVSVTIGISSLPGREANRDDLVRTADAAMYQGKSAGKNRVVVYRAE